MTNRKRNNPSENATITLVCPSCLARYACPPSELGGQPRLCHYCRVPLVREDGSRNRFRCLGCTKRVITPEGVWCTQFERAPTPEEADRCREFEARSVRPTRRRRSA